MPTRYDFLLDTYRTERLKTLTLWSQVPDDRMNDRIEEQARPPREHMVHQSLSEEAWMRNMLGIRVSHPALPADEQRLPFIERYGLVSSDRLAQLDTKDDAWFEGETAFFDVHRSRAWILTRRLLSFRAPSCAAPDLPPARGRRALLDLRPDGRHRRTCRQ